MKKKLKIHRETLHRLGREDLQRAAAGAMTWYCDDLNSNSCTHSQRDYCREPTLGGGTCI